MEEQKKKKSPVGMILLIILLLLAGAVGYLYYTVFKAPMELDDPKALAAAAPMSAEERFSVSADGTVQVKIDARDFWNLVYQHVGENFLDMINRELEGYGLSVTGCAIRMEETGLALDLELLYKENRLVAKVPCDLQISGRQISLAPAGVKLGIVSLPVKSLLSNLKLEAELSLPVISEVTQVEFAQDALLLSGPMEDICALVPQEKIQFQMAIFSQEMQYVADALQTEAGFSALLSDLEKNPGNVEELYHKLFMVADPEVTESYLESRLGLTERFFPGIDFGAISTEQAALAEQLTVQSNALEQLFTEVVNIYNEKRFQLSEGAFLFAYNSWEKKNPFLLAEYGAQRYGDLFAVLDPEAFYLILVDAEDGFIRKTSSFYRMAQEGLEFTQEVDYNKTYILGYLFRSVDGDPYLLYEKEIREGNTYARNFRYVPLTEEEVAKLQVPGKFGVWTG